jgi:uncharacterized protein (TIGR03437 family)
MWTPILFICAAVTAEAQNISTIAGSSWVFPAQPLLAVQAPLGGVSAVAVGKAGNYYVVDSSNNLVLKIDASGTLSIVTGNGSSGHSGDGGPATSAELNYPSGIAVDGAGNLFIADTDNNRIRMVSPGGVITTVAGNGIGGYSGDGGPATSAEVSLPLGVAVDGVGNLFIADTRNQRIRIVNPAGVITTAAGNGTAGYSGDGGKAVSAELGDPGGVAVDRAGNLFIADTAASRIRMVNLTGIITTIAGNGSCAFAGDGGLATAASLCNPEGVVVSGAGDVFIADYVNRRIREVGASGIITTVAGDGVYGYSGDGGPATSASLVGPLGVAVDNNADNVLITDGERVRKVATNGIITTVAGDGDYHYGGDGGPATSAQLNGPSSVAADGAGNLYIADAFNNRIRMVSPGGVITTVAGNGAPSYSGDGGPATSAELAGPGGVAVDSAGDIFIADGANNRIRMVTPGGIITTVAGNGARGYSGDGGPATSALLWGPTGIVLDHKGNVFIADSGNNRIRMVSPGGVVTTVAGNGTHGYSGDGGPATNASLNLPWSVAVDNAGNLFIADSGNNRVRQVAPGGTITTVAGNGMAGYSGDGGPATNAKLQYPYGVTVDSAGKLFIADSGNDRIRMVSPGGTITTVVGNGTYGYSGDGGPATSASLGSPQGVALDPAGDLLIADSLNYRIREVPGLAAALAVTVSAASGTAPVAPGSIVSIYGSNLATTGTPATILPLPTNLGGTSVTITDSSSVTAALPLFYAGPTQINAEIPQTASTGTATLTITTPSGTQTASVMLAAVAPGLFTANQNGKGVAAAQLVTNESNGQQTVVDIFNSPCAAGSCVGVPLGVSSGQTALVLFGTGIRNRASLSDVAVTIGSQTLPAFYAGPAPNYTGLDQVNVLLPASLAGTGTVNITVSLSGTESNVVTATFK